MCGPACGLCRLLFSLLARLVLRIHLLLLASQDQRQTGCSPYLFFFKGHFLRMFVFFVSPVLYRVHIVLCAFILHLDDINHMQYTHIHPIYIHNNGIYIYLSSSLAYYPIF